MREGKVWWCDGDTPFVLLQSVPVRKFEISTGFKETTCIEISSHLLLNECWVYVNFSSLPIDTQFYFYGSLIEKYIYIEGEAPQNLSLSRTYGHILVTTALRKLKQLKRGVQNPRRLWGNFKTSRHRKLFICCCCC